jgi:hypothetical protein
MTAEHIGMYAAVEKFSKGADRKKGFLAHFFKKQETSLSKSV